MSHQMLDGDGFLVVRHIWQEFSQSILQAKTSLLNHMKGTESCSKDF